MVTFPLFTTISEFVDLLIARLRTTASINIGPDEQVESDVHHRIVRTG